MNCKKNCTFISFNLHPIHNEFIISIMNLYHNGLMGKEGKNLNQFHVMFEMIQFFLPLIEFIKNTHDHTTSVINFKSYGINQHKFLQDKKCSTMEYRWIVNMFRP